MPSLRRLVVDARRADLPLPVRLLFGMRSLAGRVFRWDAAPPGPEADGVRRRVPRALAEGSVVPTGTFDGPFEVLFVLPHEAAYQVVNATVHAIVHVAVVSAPGGHEVLWATHVKPVGRVTALYMAAIDPFRRLFVYPGLESWLQRAWARHVQCERPQGVRPS